MLANIIIFPSQLRPQICQLYHDSLTSGHLGFEKKFKAVALRFYWPRMKSQIYDYWAICDVYQRFKQRNQSNTAPLISIKVNKPWDLIAIDIAGPLKLTNKGNKYFIVAVDHFSKFLVTRALANYTGETTIAFIRDDVINKHGTPTAILSDQGTNFECKAFEAYCREAGVKKVRTTSYHPKCNGFAERTIKTNRLFVICQQIIYY